MLVVWVGVVNFCVGERREAGAVAVWMRRWCWWAGWALYMLLLESVIELVVSPYGNAGAGGLCGRCAWG